MKRLLVSSMLLAALCGCVSATATRTSQSTSGVVTTDSIKTSAFLASLHNGAYSNGTGMTLTVTDATPDQQSIAILAGGVVDLAKTFMLATTNSATVTNAPTK